MDRTAGRPGWMVVKPFVTQASNCILPAYLIAASFGPYVTNAGLTVDGGIEGACGQAYIAHVDPLTGLTDKENPTLSKFNSSQFPPPGYVGFDPLSVDPNAPADVNNGLGLPGNNGEGFSKNLSGNQLPNAPHFTTSLAADYTMPVSQDWAATLHSDFYWQSQSWGAGVQRPALRQDTRLLHHEFGAHSHQCIGLAGDGLCEERLRRHRHHRRFPEQR